jgi:hypothetical protein
MATNHPPEKAPAKKAGADRLVEKRAIAAERRESKAAFDAQYGEGHNKIENFLDAFKQYDDFKDPADLEDFHYYAIDIALAIRAYLTHETRTLDKAFKVRRPDGYRQPAERKRYLRMKNLQSEGRMLREHGAKADVELWQLLAERHLTNPATAREWYYLANKGVCPDPKKDSANLPQWVRDRLFRPKPRR